MEYDCKKRTLQSSKIRRVFNTNQTKENNIYKKRYTKYGNYNGRISMSYVGVR